MKLETKAFISLRAAARFTRINQRLVELVVLHLDQSIFIKTHAERQPSCDTMDKRKDHHCDVRRKATRTGKAHWLDFYSKWGGDRMRIVGLEGRGSTNPKINAPAFVYQVSYRRAMTNRD